MAAFDKQYSVLVVDDEEDILELLGEYLRARGYEVLTASDGSDAIEIIREGGADMVVTDLKMPTMGGLELLQEINQLSRHVPTVVMTGFGSVETAIRAMKEGAHDYLLKPFKLREVHGTLVRAIELLNQQTEDERVRDLLAFYELALSLNNVGELPRLYGAVAGVAQAETEADEVALWMQGPEGWEAVARGGVVQSLGGVNPDDLVGSPPSGVIALPIHFRGGRAGILAVAGSRSKAHEGRLHTFTRVVSETLDRVGWLAAAS